MPKLDPCMFCFSLPCECEGSKPKKQSKPRKKVASSTEQSSASQSVPSGASAEKVVATAPETKIDLRAAMKARVVETVHLPAPAAPAPKPRMHEAMKAAAVETKHDDEDLVRAIAALDPILHPDEREKHAAELSSPVARAVKWRARNARSE